MHSDPEAIPDAIEVIRRCFTGPIEAYAETGSWTTAELGLRRPDTRPVAAPGSWRASRSGLIA
jgi:hypothetical protein